MTARGGIFHRFREPLPGRLQHRASFIGAAPGIDEPALGALLQALEPAQLSRALGLPGLFGVF
jgi:hypothetical protein